MRIIPVAALAVLLAPALARADFDAGPFPMAKGNRWVYERSGGQVTVSVDQAQTLSGARWYRLRGFNGASHWVRQTAAGRIYAGSNATWYRFDAAVGAGWTFRVTGGAIPGSNGARVEVVSTSESVTVPAGTFTTIHLRWRAQAVDAGITDEWFARGVGLVKRTETSIAGPRTMSLLRATVSGVAIPASGGGGGGIVGVLGGQGAFGIDGIVPAARVRLRTVLDQGLARPVAMAFHRDGSLWISNRDDDTTLVVDRPGAATMSARRFRDDSAHFMNNPMQLAFSRSRLEFAVALESVNDYNGAAPPNLFTGPTVFTADRSIFEGGTMSHLDMLHHSPNAVGIAAGAAPAAGPDRREYWVFNGNSGSIDRYFFNAPHALGAHDHSDGETYRYGRGLRRVAGVPGHLALDVASGILYIADTGNGRLAKLDTRAGDVTQAAPIAGYHAETPLLGVPNARIDAVTQPGVLTAPAGLLLSGGKLVVSDHATGHLLVFHPDGTLLGDADTGVGARALMGLVEAPGGKLWVLDGKQHRLLEVSIAP